MLLNGKLCKNKHVYNEASIVSETEVSGFRLSEIGSKLRLLWSTVCSMAFTCIIQCKSDF